MVRGIAKFIVYRFVTISFVVLGLIRKIGLCKKRRILLHCSSAAMIAHLRNFGLCCKDIPKVALYWHNHGHDVCNFKPDDSLNAKVVGNLMAVSYPWDLIVCADHIYKNIYNYSVIPLLYIGHGPWAKVLNSDFVPYAICSYARAASGDWKYKAIFCASHGVKNHAEKLVSDISGRLMVVGDLMADRVLQLVRLRSGFRSKLGLKDGDVLVALLGSWGENSLFRMHGAYLAGEARTVGCQRFRFVMSIHPHEFGRTAAVEGFSGSWGEYYIALTDGSENFCDWQALPGFESYLIAADIVVADHTSVAEYAVLLGTPVISAAIGDAQLWKDSVRYKYREIAPKLDTTRSLAEQLNSVLEYYPADEMRMIANEITSFPGTSANRVRDAVNYLVGLKSDFLQ